MCCHHFGQLPDQQLQESPSLPQPKLITHWCYPLRRCSAWHQKHKMTMIFLPWLLGDAAQPINPELKSLEMQICVLKFCSGGPAFVLLWRHGSGEVGQRHIRMLVLRAWWRNGSEESSESSWPPRMHVSFIGVKTLNFDFFGAPVSVMTVYSPWGHTSHKTLHLFDILSRSRVVDVSWAKWLWAPLYGWKVLLHDVYCDVQLVEVWLAHNPQVRGSKPLINNVDRKLRFFFGQNPCSAKFNHVYEWRN